MNTTDVGEGVAVLALHGAPGSVRDWRWLGPVLEPHLRLIRLDLPGFGATPVGTFPHPGFPERARFVVDVADALGLDRFVVLGHSVGGPLALHLAAARPDRVAGLALVSSVGLRAHRLLRANPWFHHLAPVLRLGLPRRLLLPVLRRGFLKAGFHPTTTLEAVQQTLELVPALDFAANAARARELRLPVFHAWAADDAFIEDAVSRELCDALPQPERLRFEVGGHNPQKTQAVELGAALLRWIEGLPSRDS